MKQALEQVEMVRMKQALEQAEKETKKGRKQKGTAKPVRIAHLKPHEHAVATRQEYTPGLLVVKCKEDIVANVPDIHAARLAAVRTLSLPKVVEDPFQDLAQKQLIREVIPIFSRLTQGRSLSVAPVSVVLPLP